MTSDPVTPPPCPTCGKPPVQRYRPFCSARCQQVDLGRWFQGTYRIETDEPPEEESRG